MTSPDDCSYDCQMSTGLETGGKKAEKKGDHLNINRIKIVNLTDGLNRDGSEWKSDYIFPKWTGICVKREYWVKEELAH